MANTLYPLGRWQPWNPHEVAAFFAALQTPWWIAGGWALDLFIGRQTRAHDDIDVQILRRDHHAVRSLFQSWDVQAALPPPRDENWPFRPWHINEELDLAVHDIWCRPTSTQPWALQLMIADTHDDLYICRRSSAIVRSVATLGRITTEGIPYLAPEIQLLYKAKGLRPKDEDDFTQTLPFLNQERRCWLKDALSLISPHHPWLSRLE
ncbi:MAG: aminoglycoside adenylyltransferase [Ktedonobacterales bacterium]|nr:aminoglycoside adenylyltransferase [Ktedonobacterales bacterium]